MAKQEQKLEKAKLLQLKPDFTDVDPDATPQTVVVQFNPETLKVSYQNSIEKPEGGGDNRGSPSLLFVGSATTKLSCNLWFDVNAPLLEQKGELRGQSIDDVRKLTNRVTYFLTAHKDKKDPKKFRPSGVRFLWGSFLFDGLMESVEESIEFFSPQGSPLRANVAISIVQQRLVIFPPESLDKTAKPALGTRPTTPVPSGSSVQKMAGQDWQRVALANNVENPRLPRIGLRLDLGRR